MTQPPKTSGNLVHWAGAYDALVWILLHGRTRDFHERILDLADIGQGQSVLDVGCGTGSLAIAAGRRIGANGIVHGIDGAPEMIERSRKKAASANADVTFTHAVVEQLPFPDAHFDRVLCSMMLHHLPRSVRVQCAREMSRVLRPGGKVVVVEFSRDGQSLIEKLHRHGALNLSHIHEVLQSAGLHIADTGRVGIQGLNYTVAVRETIDSEQPRSP